MYGQKPYSFLPYADLILQGSAVAAGPFAQYDWAKPVNIRLSKPQADFYQQHLLTNPIPFSQNKWPNTNPLPPAVPHQFVYNPNLFKNIIPMFSSDSDWQKTFAIRQSTPHQFVYNPNLFKNPIPFAQYNWSKPIAVQLAVPHQFVYNPNLFTNPIATFSSDADWSKPAAFKPSVAHQYVFNPNLFTTVAVTLPFNQYDWPLTKNIKGYPGLSDQGIWKFEIPFAQYTWPNTFFPRPTPVLISQNNLALTTVIGPAPFSQTDWPLVHGIKGYPGLSDQGIWAFQIPFAAPDMSSSRFRYFKPAQIDGAIIDITQPFSQTDWSRPQAIRIAGSQAYVYNPNLFTAVAVAAPFYQTDWPAVHGVKSAVPHQYVYNPNLFVGIVQPPFFKTDWSKPFWPIPSKSRGDHLNLCLYSNPIPFAQYDWSKPVRNPVDRGRQVGVNLNLYKNPIPVFNPASTVTNPIRFTSVPQTVNFQLLNAIPVPVVTVRFDPFVKKRSKQKRDRIREELEIKYKRRLAIEEAFWPPTTYELPEYKLPENVRPAPDVSDLANLIMQVHAMRAKQAEIDDEEDLMKLLRDEYGITDV